MLMSQTHREILRDNSMEILVLFDTSCSRNNVLGKMLIKYAKQWIDWQKVNIYYFDKVKAMNNMI